MFVLRAGGGEGEIKNVCGSFVQAEMQFETVFGFQLFAKIPCLKCFRHQIRWNNASVKSMPCDREK